MERYGGSEQVHFHLSSDDTPDGYAPRATESCAIRHEILKKKWQLDG
jgi:hypothetical protein